MDSSKVTLEEWQDRYYSAHKVYDPSLSLFSQWEAIYLGSKEIDRSVNSGIYNGGSYVGSFGNIKRASNVRNICFELIESQIDSNVPLPKVDALSDDNEELAKIIEDSLKADMSKLMFENLNDASERLTPIHGMSFFEVLWDNLASKRGYYGDIKVRLLHPKQVIPQPGVSSIQEMDYFFVLSSVTKRYICERYEVSEEDLTSSFDFEGNSSYDDMVTEVVVWYKNRQGRVSRYVFCGDVVLEDIDDYYARRIWRCANCGEPNITSSRKCECGFSSFKNVIEATEDIVIRDEKGERLVTVPYYIPDVYPVVMRQNIPFSFGFGGQSDIDIIRDQQNTVKKLYTKIEEKLLKGGSFIEVPDSLKNRMVITDDELKIVYKRPMDQSIAVHTVQADISKDMQFVENQIRAASETLGITDSFMGKSDKTATSGYAKQLLIQQSSGRLRSKQFNKFSAYKELFEVMFKFKLAFSDEPRPFVSHLANGRRIYNTFNKTDFVACDEFGSYYYNDDFLFSVDSSGGLPSDRGFMYEQALKLYQLNGFGPVSSPPALVRLWEALEAVNFPLAAQFKEQFEREAGQLEQSPQSPQSQSPQLFSQMKSPQ